MSCQNSRYLGQSFGGEKNLDRKRKILSHPGLNVGKVFVGGTEQKIDGTGTTAAFDGCIEVRNI